MENNPELQLAWQFIENTGTHLFLTGKAGTGKTTFLRRLKEHTPKRMVILAPTGIAAINAGGVTIHSFFQLSFAPFVPETTFNSSQTHYRYSKEKRNIIRSMDLLVIDEISMVRADLLDAVDATLRRYRDREKPFGGVQLLMIGDLQQLAPVVKDNEWELLRKHYETPYFFASHALKETAYMTIELKKVYRQSDTFFLSLLNKIRENKADDEVLNELNRRYQPGFQPQKEEGYIRLTTHNNQAQRVNDCELASLPGKAYHFSAEIEGDFPEYSYPADKLLTIKEGAQIMFLKNDPSSEKRYYNGMIGEVVAVNETGIVVRGKLLQTFDTDCAKIGVLICYDVEFPELSRLMADQGMQILFVPFLTDTQNAYSRVRVCAQARAIENECFVVIAGSVGNLPRVHNMDIQYAQSGVFTPCDFAFPTDGKRAEATPNTEMILVSDVDLDLLNELHTYGSVRNLKDRRSDVYEVRLKK